MKCVKKVGSGEIRRVKDAEAEAMVKKDWSYCPKSEWKAGKKPVKVEKAKKKGEDKEDSNKSASKGKKGKKTSKYSAKKINQDKDEVAAEPTKV